MFEVAELGQKLSKADFKAREPELREALLDAQFRLRDSDTSVLVVIGGVEGSGKGAVLKKLLEWLDARYVQVRAFNQPNDEEKLRPRFWRFWQKLPPCGTMGIFFRGWYHDAIAEHVFGQTTTAQFDRHLGRIVHLERMLAKEGVLVLKYWLHISKEEQGKRFEELESHSESSWRVRGEDWEYHRRFDDVARATAHAIRRTSRGHAPWEIIEARDARFREMTIAESILAALDARLAQGAAASANGNGELIGHDDKRDRTPSPVNIINSLDLSQKLDKAIYSQQLETYQNRMAQLSRQMAERRAAVLVFEGSDAAGKGGAIRRTVRALDPRFYRVIPISAPTEEERAQPYLWRFWRHLPRLGHLTVYDRSWYGRVLVERVEGFCSRDDWRRAYAEINAFEEQLVEGGILVMKFWLAISAEEQLERFHQREATGYKRHKITDEDWRNREQWDAYEAATCDMIEQTSTELAPWTLVEAEDKRFARVKVIRTVVETLERALKENENEPRWGVDLGFPTVERRKPTGSDKKKNGKKAAAGKKNKKSGKSKKKQKKKKKK